MGWIERQGHALIRRGLAGDALFLAGNTLGLGALLFLCLRKKPAAKLRRTGRLERRWESWRFFQEFFTAEVLALLVSFLVSLPYYSSGNLETGMVLSMAFFTTIPVLWLLVTHMPGIRAGLAYFMPETRSGIGSNRTARPSPVRILLGGLAGLGGLLLVSQPLAIAGFGTTGLTDILHAESLDSPIRVLLSFCHSVILAPFAEEIVFRGFLYGALRAKLGMISAAVLSSILFAAIHGYTVEGFVFIFLSGLVFVAIYQRSGSLLPGMIAHGALNFIITAQISGWFSFH